MNHSENRVNLQSMLILNWKVKLRTLPWDTVSHKVFLQEILVNVVRHLRILSLKKMFILRTVYILHK